MEEKYYCGSFCEYTSNEVRKYFDKSTGKNVKIGVVDSGWDCSLTDTRIKDGISFLERNKEIL